MPSDNNSLLAQNARQILTRAAMSDIGLEVKVEVVGDLPSPALRAKQILYRFKKENRDWQHIQVRLHPTEPENKIWVINTPNVPMPDDPDENPEKDEVEIDL